MNENMVVREWYDEDNDITYCIRFVKINDMWWAVLKDICFALGLEAKHVAQRIDVDFILKRVIPTYEKDKVVSNDLMSKPYHNTHQMLLVNENGIYQCIAGSRKTEAKKFNKWYPQMIAKLRKGIGLEGFMALDMMNENVQKHIDEQLDKYVPEFDPLLDYIYYDESTGKLMTSVTLPGGDVEQFEYIGDIPYPYNLYSFN